MKHENVTAMTDGLLTSEGFLRFALRFAQCDLHALRPGDWLNLREDFETYLARKGLLSIAVSPSVCLLPSVEKAPLPEDFTAQDFERLQGGLLNVFLREVSRAPGGRSILDAEMFSVFRHGWQHDMPGVRQIVVHGTTEQCFRGLLEWLLLHEPTDRIKQCPECGALFYRIKQQAYCSRACGNRLAVRNWRARQDTPATASP